MDSNTLFIISKTNDPAFNLAAEEILLRNHNEKIIFFYINKPSVIVGKHQNTLSEINYDFLEQNKIPVYRRLSGGGTVYHDYGNINYCIIENGEPGHLVDFVRATTPVVEALKDFGLDARHGKRNDLLAGYKKISGNACHVYKTRVMHHGTLLFNSDLTQLTESLKADATKFQDRSVKSVRSEVVNISELVPGEKNAESFLLKIGNSLRGKFKARSYHFSENDLELINKLIITKYNTWKWNYGYSPLYEFTKRSKSEDYIFSSKIKVEKGFIRELTIKSNHPEKEKLKEIESKIINQLHEKTKIKQILIDANNDLKTGIIECLF